MTADIVDALLWRSRAVLRLDVSPLHAGHGLADPLYRPPRLPYASVLGPLSYAVEPERDLPRERSLTVRIPGYLAGSSLPEAAVVPAPGALELLVDGDVRVDVAVDHGLDAGQALTDERADGVAEQVQQAVLDAVAAGAASIGGVPVADPERLEELARVTVRWDRPNRRFVMASGRRGPVAASTSDVSAVRLAAPTPYAEQLGWDAGALTPTGRLTLHQVPAPIAMAFDVRVDLWAGSQRHLAALVESWARVTPTRCQMLLRPGLPSADVPDGATEVRLQARGEPATRWTRLQLENEGGFADRRTGRAVTVSGGSTTGPAGITLPAGGAATTTFLPRPAVPDPLAPAHPAPVGWAVSTDVRVTGADGDERTVATLRHGATVALGIAVRWALEPSGNGAPPVLTAHVRAVAEAADSTSLPEADVPVPAAALDAGARMHALVDATSGRTAVWVDDVGALGAAVGPVEPTGGDGMVLDLGGGPGPQLDLEHVHVLARPLGPLDHRHRATAATADRWRPGDAVTLVRSDDGATPRGVPFTAVVVAVRDGELVLDRPVVGTWSRHDTLVGGHLVFSRQTAVHRRDDLAANLARVCLEHTVSGYVEPEGAASGARLVETVDTQLLEMPLLPADVDRPAPARAVQGAPGTRIELVPARALRSTVTVPQDADEGAETEAVEQA